MVTTRSGGRSTVVKRDPKKIDDGSAKRRKSGKGPSSKPSSEAEAGVAATGYEEKRAQRMKENMERMKQLGILGLSTQFKQESASFKKRAAPVVYKRPTFDNRHRRSSRLKAKDTVSYSDVRTSKEKKVERDEVVSIQEGAKPELYREEHEKLLGDSKTTWILYVDGFDEEGERVYDTFLGKSCHQCRQKTLGRRTSCSKCKTFSGQFCGDCLYTRYGENVIEVNENRDWICPVCRGICNCNSCRRKNGWAPTGLIYEKVKSLGFKSVAHYLIQTFRSEPKSQEPASVSAESENASWANTDEGNDSDDSSSGSSAG